MSDRIGEQILVESYKVLYDYIAMNESEDTKFDLQIKTFQKIEKTLSEEAKSKRATFEKLMGNREKLEDPIVILNSMDDLYIFYWEHENDALELLKMISSNDVDGMIDAGYAKRHGSYLIDNVNDIGALAPNIYRLPYIDDYYLSRDKYKDNYKKFILKAFPVWVKSAKRLLSAANKYSKG